MKWFAERADLIDELLEVGVKPQAPTPAAAGGGTLTGKTFVITGTLTKPRAAIEAAIKAAGGKTSGSVSKNTTAVVTGDPNSGSSKMKKAATLGIDVINEVTLDAWIAG